MSAIIATNISSFSKIFDQDGNGESFYRTYQYCIGNTGCNDVGRNYVSDFSVYAPEKNNQNIC